VKDTDRIGTCRLDFLRYAVLPGSMSKIGDCAIKPDLAASKGESAFLPLRGKVRQRASNQPATESTAKPWRWDDEA